MTERFLIELKDLTRYYGQVAAVMGVNLKVQAGEIVALLGPNGAGKTTTIRMLVGQLRPTRGNASRIGGYDCFSGRSGAMRITGYVPDEPIFHDYLTGRELLRFVGGLHGLNGEQIVQAGTYWVERLSLGDAIDDYAVDYSRGMKKKLALALAVLHKPRLLILDEPANGLDPLATRVLLELLTEQAIAGTAILFSTHLLDQAEKFCHRAVIISRGRLVAEGNIDDLRNQAANGGNLEQAFFALTAESQGVITQPTNGGIMNATPSQWTMLRLIVGLAIRRNIHQIFANIALANRTRKDFLADRRRHAEGTNTRLPTPRKRTTVGLFTAFFMGMIFLEVFLFSATFLGSLSIEHKLQPETFHKLEQIPEKMGLDCNATYPFVRIVVYDDPFISGLPEAQQESTVDLISQHWVNGLYGNCSNELDPITDFIYLSKSFADPVQHELLVKFTSLITFLTLITIISANLGNILPKNFGHTDAETLWFLSLPIPSMTLLTAKVIEYAIQLENWFLLFPFMTMCAFVANHGLYSPLLAFIAVTPVVIAVASIRLSIETTTRIYARLSIRKNIQIVFSLTSTILMLHLMYIVVKGKGFELWGSDLVPWEMLPTAWPLRAIFNTGFDFWYWWAVGTLLFIAISIVAIALAVYAIRNGFIAESDTLQGKRVNNTIGYSQFEWLPLSVIGKDLRMLRRDRLFMFNILMTPIIAIGTQFMLNPELIGTIINNFRHACTLAYVVAAYLLLPSATTLLSAEGPALWLLIATPQPLLQLLQQKLWLWTSLALTYTTLAFVGVMFFVSWPGSTGIADVVMMVLGVPIFAVIAAGIGAANDDPNVIDPKLRINASARTTLLMVMLMHGQAIYTTDWHTRLVWLTLCTVFAYSLWQRLEERLPWLLDPTDNPPERIDLTHGALAAMYFMVLQTLISIPLVWMEFAPEHVLLIAFAGAGITTALGALWGFWRSNLPNVFLSTGLMPRSDWRTAIRDNFKWGIAGGITAAIFGSVYVAIVSQFPLIMDEIPVSADPMPISILLAITVLTAPIAEEFIFRGLLFAGLAATVPIYWAVPASAAVFALIHPSIAVLPVFVMGCIAAITYHKSGWLLAPMLVHAIYNGMVVLM